MIKLMIGAGSLAGAVDADFPTATTRERRFIDGLSMGGYGALYLGLKYPDRFSAIGAHSPALFQRGAEGAPIGVYGADWSHYDERAPQVIIRRDGWPADMRLCVDIGFGDGFLMLGVGRSLRRPTRAAEPDRRV